jgi:sugar transferase (PEP-CTERM/EpsH1 system associated)
MALPDPAMSTPANEVLFLAHRIPWPPDRGDRIRSWHLLQALAARAKVHCGCLIEGKVAPAQVEAVASLSDSWCLAPRTPSLGLAAVAALLTGRPISVAAFSSLLLRRWVRQVLAANPIGTIFVFSGQMAQYVPHDFAGRVVMDFVDVDSAKFAAYAATARSKLVRSIHAREARVLAAFEARAAQRADVSLLVTPQERDLFVSRLPDPAACHVATLGNGIDAARFSPAAVAPERGAGAGPQIVFTGQMDYAPNAAAVALFANHVMPAILAHWPEARFSIVGRAPGADVRALDGRNGTHVTGEVPDVRPWLAGADLVVAPLQIARGVQNKVLEAMAMARPVLLTSAAATGIAGQDGVHFAVADGADALAARALALLADRAAADAMGTAAREHVLAHAGWDRALATLPAIMGWADAG